MGGVARIIKKNPHIFKPKTPEEGKETSKRLDKVLTKNAEEGNEVAWCAGGVR